MLNLSCGFLLTLILLLSLPTCIASNYRHQLGITLLLFLLVKSFFVLIFDRQSLQLQWHSDLYKPVFQVFRSSICESNILLVFNFVAIKVFWQLVHLFFNRKDCVFTILLFLVTFCSNFRNSLDSLLRTRQKLDHRNFIKLICSES